MNESTSTHPQDTAPRPPFPEQQQTPPGREAEMQPKPDHGEHSYRGSGRLAGKAALITGADSGIGRAVALAFAREGADVLISYLEEEDDALETQRWVEEAGRKALRVPGDIGSSQHCQDLVQRALSEFGRLDVLVNNAAMQRTHQHLSDVSADELERTFRTNVFGMFYLCQAALPLLQEHGAIINTTSIQAYDPSPTLLPYAATKGAIAVFTQALAQAEDAVQRKIRVNAVAPGPIWTPLIPSTMPAEQVANFGKNTPLQRPGQPAELAPVYVFLASSDASYITGEIIGVTGGRPL